MVATTDALRNWQFPQYQFGQLQCWKISSIQPIWLERQRERIRKHRCFNTISRTAVNGGGG